MTDTTWAAKVLEGVPRCHTPDGTYLHQDAVLAAIAAAVPADLAEVKEMALDVLASSGQAAEAYAAQLAAEAERDALRERVARLEGAGDFARLIGNDDGKDDKDTVLVSYGMLRRLRASLIDKD